MEKEKLINRLEKAFEGTRYFLLIDDTFDLKMVVITDKKNGGNYKDWYYEECFNIENIQEWLKQDDKVYSLLLKQEYVELKELVKVAICQREEKLMRILNGTS